MARNNCPYCQKKIGYLRKLLFFSDIYAHPCPHCGKKLKVKNIGYFWGFIIFLLLFTILFIFPDGEFTFLKKLYPLSI